MERTPISFKVTVEVQVEETFEARGDMCMQGYKFLSAEDYENLDYIEKQRWEKDKTEIGTISYRQAVYDYGPKIERSKVVATKIFEQTVTTLDMAALVAVINNLN